MRRIPNIVTTTVGFYSEPINATIVASYMQRPILKEDKIYFSLRIYKARQSFIIVKSDRIRFQWLSLTLSINMYVHDKTYPRTASILDRQSLHRYSKHIV